MRSRTGYIAECLEPRLLLSVDSQSTPSAFAGMPAVFVPNQGQWDQAIRYAAHGTGADILFTDTGPTFRIVDRPDTPRDPFARGPGFDEAESLTGTRPVTVNEWSLSFVDAARVAPIGLDQQQTVFNYYLGNDPSTWRAGVSSFGGVVYRDLWRGIDAHVMARDGGMKYEFHLDPGADPQNIALRYQGVEGLSLSKAGGLSIRTSGGTITDDSPVAWQTRRDGARVEVAAEFVVLDQFTYTIAPTGAYDPSLPLVLDPQLVFGSYLGGNGFDSAHDIVSDGTGGAWLTGQTSSGNFPTPGGFDTTYNDGYDAFVARITAEGTLAFASYLGGGGSDAGAGIAPDGGSGVWVTGLTNSADFPTLGGFDTTYNDGRDVFVARVTAGGTLAFGSYLGGSSTDDGYGIASDGTGGVWLTGWTTSDDFPTPGGFDTTYNGGFGDALVARITADGALAFASYLGGSGGDSAGGITSDGAGGVWVVGQSTSADFPTPGGFDTTYNGTRDAFVARVTSVGSFAFASYLGGVEGDYGEGIAPDGAGGAWVTGYTESANFPTPGGFDTTYNGGTSDIFVARVTASGTLAFASYLGGSLSDIGRAIAPDSNGGVWVTGQTQSANFPTPAGFDTTGNGGNSDVFIAHVTAGGTLDFGSYLGGGGNDNGNGIAPDGGGASVTGLTASADFPTPGGFDTTYDGGTYDAFVARIDNSDTAPPTVTTSQFAYESAPQSIRITFSENVSASLSLQDLTLENLTTGQTIPLNNLSLSYNTASNVATITFPGYPYGVLPNGIYRATLLAAGVTDAAGNPLPANHVLNFFFRQGDANHDNLIDFDDYVLIDQGFNNGWSGFGNGDFNYDGVIDFDDYVLIDLAFNSQ